MSLTDDILIALDGHADNQQASTDTDYAALVALLAAVYGVTV
jgi:hypothetical protein